MRSPWRETPRRRAAWLALIAAVLVAHGLVALRVVASVIGWNDAEDPRRIEVALVQELAPTAPPPVAPAAPAAPAPRPARAVRAAAQAGSAPDPSASAADEAASASHDALRAQALALAASAAEAQAPASAASAPVAVAEAPASAAAPADAEASAAGPVRPPFQWPPSTRLTYTLTGMYRNGPLYGSAVVEWRREGTHYQVQFDIHVSPFFDQHMASDGEIVDTGLSPRRYDESFKVPLLAPRVRRIEFGDTLVTLSNGSHAVKLPQTQDGASQFVQFVWMFYGHPEWLKPGHVFEIPLAINSNLRRWRYEVVDTETLKLGFGALDAVHLKPMLDGPRRANEYPFEIWTAPTLQYLPVRILVRLDDENFADLSLDRLPLQAAPAADPASSAP